MRSAVIHLPMQQKIIYGGCGIAYAQMLPKHVSARVNEDAARLGLALGTVNSSTNPALLIPHMLKMLDLRSNGEGTGIAWQRTTSSLHQLGGFPNAYKFGEMNLFTIFAMASTREEIAALVAEFAGNGFELRRDQLVYSSGKTRDILKGQEVYEIAVIVRPENEAAFVRFCNRINARSGPKIYSVGVNTGLLKIVGRADELEDAFAHFLGNKEYVWALGHGRYPTNTPDGLLASQPHGALSYNDSGIVAAFCSENGEVTNHLSLSAYMRAIRHFHLGNVANKVPTDGRDGISTLLTRSDGEAIPHLINHLLARGLSPDQIGDVLCGKRNLPFGNGILGISGPVAVVAPTTKGVIAFRDSRRLRPLVATVAGNGIDAYLFIASEEGAIRDAANKYGLGVISSWNIKESLVLGNEFDYETFSRKVPKLGTGVFRGEIERFIPGITTRHSVFVDIGEIRRNLEAQDLSTMFRRNLFPGDSGKCFDDFQTYVQRKITLEIRRMIRSEVFNRLDKGDASIELDVRLYGLRGERHLCVGVINDLLRSFGKDKLPQSVKINWVLEGIPGDNVGAFCSSSTKITSFGNVGECPANTARGLDLTVHGSGGGSVAYAASAGTRVFIEYDAGPRCGTYLKGSKKESPLVVVGRTIAEYGGECAHNGTILVLNRDNEKEPVGHGVGVGIEGNARVIFRGTLGQKLAAGVSSRPANAQEMKEIRGYVEEYCRRFKYDNIDELMHGPFTVVEKDRDIEVHPSIPVVAAKEDVPFPPEVVKRITQMAGVKKDGTWDPRTIHGVRLVKGMGAIPHGRPLNAAMVTAPAVDSREETNITEMLNIPLAQQNMEGQPYDDKAAETGCYTTGIIIGSQSYGAINPDTWQVIYNVAAKLGILMGSGEGGLPPQLENPDWNLIRQIASGRFGIKTDDVSLKVDYFQGSKIVEIKIGQGAKPGKGGTLSAAKVTEAVAETRGIEPGTSAVSSPTHHDAYSIEDVKKLIELVRMVAGVDVKVAVKFAATNDLEQICVGLVKGGANILNISGCEGGTGFASVTSNETGISVFEATERAHKALIKEGLRNFMSLVASGAIWNGKQVVEVMALGANAVEMATAIDVAMGCNNCQGCPKGDCHAGETSVSSEKLNPEAAQRLETYLRTLFLEIKDVLQQNGVRYLTHATGNANLIKRDVKAEK